MITQERHAPVVPMVHWYSPWAVDAGRAGWRTKSIIAIAVAACDDHPSRFWRLVSVGRGYYNIINSNSDRCLTIAGGSTANNARAVQWYCDGHLSRNWPFVDVGLPFIRIKNQLSVASA